MNSKLSLTLGLLWAYNPASYEIYGNSSNVLFDLASKRSEIVVPNRQSEDVFNLMKNILFPYMTVRRATELDDTLIRNPHLNFAPRLGIAYQVNSKTVIRTGYGIYYGFPDVVNAVPSLNPPSRVRFDLIGNNVNPTIFIDKPQVPSNPFSTTPLYPFMTARDPNTKPDLTQMYNFSVQRQLGGPDGSGSRLHGQSQLPDSDR